MGTVGTVGVVRVESVCVRPSRDWGLFVSMCVTSHVTGSARMVQVHCFIGLYDSGRPDRRRAEEQRKRIFGVLARYLNRIMRSHTSRKADLGWGRCVMTDYSVQIAGSLDVHRNSRLTLSGILKFTTVQP